jgi:UDP-N-acetylmuramate--alanine ligase
MTRNFHFIGIGGSGLSAIARVLLERGERVSGSDRQPSAAARSLQAAGARITIGHQVQNVSGADIVVRSSAVPDENVEVQSARSAGIPVLKRVEFMPELLAGYQVIAVAGTHGKTTTTAMIAWLLTALQMDPSFIIGGDLSNLGTNAHSGIGSHFVIEADEYDNMFLGLRPVMAVVTNIEHDHPDFFPTWQGYQAAFRKFANQLTESGTLFPCLDNPGSRQLACELAMGGYDVFGYGLAEQSAVEHEGCCVEYHSANLSFTPGRGSQFDFCRRREKLARVDLPLPGVQNVQNALAALAVVDQLSLSLSKAVSAMSEFRGTGRRFELRGVARSVTVIDDYAHHPTEIKSTLAATRSYYPKQDIWAVWQPHTYSRTRMFSSDYLSAFEDADHVLVTEIYPARETPPENGFSSRVLVTNMRHKDANFVAGNAEAVDYLLSRLTENSVLVVLSAGDADQISTDVLHGLE